MGTLLRFELLAQHATYKHLLLAIVVGATDGSLGVRGGLAMLEVGI